MQSRPDGGRSYGRGAAILSLGIGTTGLITYTYFSLASHSLSDSDYGGITLLWSAVFITVSVLYRPVEQLLARTIAHREAKDQEGREHLRVAATIQLALAAAFSGVALAVRGPLETHVFGGKGTLYWVFFVAVIGYAASYFARGFLAGKRRFGLYGALMLFESTARLCFALVVAIGIASRQAVVALGIGAAPIVSLAVLPGLFARRLSRRRMASPEATEPRLDPTELPLESQPEFTLAHGVGFAWPVLLVVLSEQTFLNAGPLLVKLTEGAHGTALAGFTFNVLLVARAPIQLFQAVQTSILPHLTRLRARGALDPFRRSVAVTIGAICVFAAAVALVLLVAGPEIMGLVFGDDSRYGRGGLVVIALGMGLYLSGATLNQAALATGQVRQAAACWVSSATAFVGFLLLPGFGDRVLQVEIGYTAGAVVLCALLYRVYRRGG